MVVTIETTFKQLILSAPTARRFALVALLGCLSNALLSTPGWPALINWSLVLLVGGTHHQLRQMSSAKGPLTLNWWRQICYWVFLTAGTLVLIATLQRLYFDLGLIVPVSLERANLAAIVGLMVALMAGGALYLFEEPKARSRG